MYSTRAPILRNRGPLPLLRQVASVFGFLPKISRRFVVIKSQVVGVEPVVGLVVDHWIIPLNLWIAKSIII